MKTFTSLLVTLTASLVATSSPSLAAACCCAEPPAAAAASALPGESLYHLAATWQDQEGRAVTLADFAGQPVIMTMIFTHCAYACPRIVADVRALRAALPDDIRDDVRIVLASFDTARDTPERLRTWAQEQNLGPAWTLLHGDDDAVRELSVLLDIPYLKQPDGSFGHGNRLVLLDAKGVAVAAVDGLGAAPSPIVDAAVQLAQGQP